MNRGMKCGISAWAFMLVTESMLLWLGGQCRGVRQQKHSPLYYLVPTLREQGSRATGRATEWEMVWEEESAEALKMESPRKNEGGRLFQEKLGRGKELTQEKPLRRQKDCTLRASCLFLVLILK